ncbi:hypothetical protein [Streptomyces sp. MP131-18]|uniref:hypothetical protein n=1 Tax=Streptomyces sp. MP131-18 TaxID=1857892 RepID=UPI00097CA206|nr:hypothetical protein [Streptomyces sp. MP131-18]ONK13294.1 hypothetical protein STBA_40570 [Streptomyces sp. MP131-18]
MAAASWSLGVVELNDGDRWATAVMQPDDEAQHGELAVRFKVAGLKRSSAREWHAGLWPPTRCTITVVNGHLIQMHTGRSRVLCDPQPVSQGWQQAAARCRVVLALAPPGTWSPDMPTAELGTTADRGRLLDTAAEGRTLLVGLAEVRNTWEPYGRRW